MKRKSEKIIFSAAGIGLIIFIAVMINFISSKLYSRVDLTENKIYTLSDASKRILQKIDTPVKIKFYFSKSNPQMPVFLKSYAKRVEDLLDEYVQAGAGKINLQKFDPEPDSDAEDTALMDGVEGQALNIGEKVYFGIAVSCLDKTSAIPFLSPDKENLLEYDITKAIAEVFKTDKTVIGIMSPLAVMGAAPQMPMRAMPQMPNQTPWLAIKNLQQSYTVKKVPFETDKIDDDIKVLVLIHPVNISEKSQYAIDKFLMQGGKLITYLDPLSYYSLSSKDPEVNKNARAGSDLPKLLEAWGIKFTPSQVVVDAQYGHKPQGRSEFLSVLDLPKEAFNKDDVSTSELESITLVFSGSFSGNPAEGLKKSVLITSSSKAGLMSSSVAESPNYIYKNFVPEDKTFDLAIKLTGKFKTAFPDGLNKSAKKEKDTKKDTSTGTSPDTAVILIGDSDILADSICVAVRNVLGRQFMIPVNDNLNFSQNIVDLLGGDTDLISIRCRPVVSRPFTKVKAMQAQAETQYKAKIQEAEKELTEAQRRLNELQRRKKNKNQRFILSPEQKTEIKKFQEKQVKIRKELKQLRKELRKDIDSLEVKLKWFNIALIPFLIALFGVITAVIRKKKGGAK
jgi:ABC-type uncharacterized transport system involved in gliding motility auxiliary subunit